MSGAIKNASNFCSKICSDGARKVSHVIFDMDGLLLDTEKIYNQVAQKILDPYNIEYTWEVKLKLMGCRLTELSKLVVEIYKLPITPEEFSELHKEYAFQAMTNVELMPDTEPIYENIVRTIAKSFGKPYPYDVRMRIMGTTDKKAAQIAVSELKLPLTIDDYLSRFFRLCREQLADAKLLPGADRLVHHLHKNNISFALATSSASDIVDVKIQRHLDLFNLFNHKVCGSDPELKNGKPAPDIFLLAAKRFTDNPTPEKCLVFEDAPNGVTAAVAANMQVVMVPDSHVPREMCQHATMILNSLEEFKPEIFGLPPFEN